MLGAINYSGRRAIQGQTGIAGRGVWGLAVKDERKRGMFLENQEEPNMEEEFPRVEKKEDISSKRMSVRLNFRPEMAALFVSATESVSGLGVATRSSAMEVLVYPTAPTPHPLLQRCGWCNHE